MKNKTALIISGGILDSPFLRVIVQNEQPDYVIAADAGLCICKQADVWPDCIVGDFDSVEQSILDVYKGKTKVITHPPEKDATDTELAIELAMEEGCNKILLCGATGGRLDHMLANIDLLKYILDCGAEGILLDEQNRITIHQTSFSVQKANSYGTYFSLIPYSDVVEGVTLQGLKYGLSEVTLQKGKQSGLCVSNEIIEEIAHIQFQTGIVLAIEAKDR